MRTKMTWPLTVFVMIALGFAVAGASLAQTATAVDVRNFEVISVAGNKLVVRDERGTQELTVPDDFRFTVDGKKLSVSDLKAGMKGTATVTTTTTVTPVVVTEVREAEVLRASDTSMTVRGTDGVRRFTQGQLDTKGIEIFKDGQSVRIADLRRGDKLTATIVTSGPPVVLTEQEVQATLAEAPAAPAGATAAPAGGSAAPATTQGAPSAGAAQTAAPQQSGNAVPAPQPAESSGPGLTSWYLLIGVVVLAIVLFVAMRRRKGA